MTVHIVIVQAILYHYLMAKENKMSRFGRQL